MGHGRDAEAEAAEAEEADTDAADAVHAVHAIYPQAELGTGGTGNGNLPALQALELALLNPVEPVVAERADERVFSDALMQLQRLEAAYAAAEPRGAPRTRWAGVPGDEQRAARSKIR